MIQVHFQRNWARNSYELYVFKSTGNGRIPIRCDFTELPEEPQDRMLAPSALIPIHESFEIITAVIKGITEIGLMPEMGATEAELLATKRHLADMRFLVFNETPPAIDRVTLSELLKDKRT